MSSATVTGIAAGARSVMASGSGAALSASMSPCARPQADCPGDQRVGARVDLHHRRRGRQSGLALFDGSAADLEDEALRRLGLELRRRRLDILFAGAHAEQPLLQLVVVGELVRPASRAATRPLTITATRLGDRGRDAEILLDQQHRDLAFLGQPRQHLDDLVDDDRRQTLRRLVHHQQPRIGQQARG